MRPRGIFLGSAPVTQCGLREREERCSARRFRSRDPDVAVDDRPLNIVHKAGFFEHPSEFVAGIGADSLPETATIFTARDFVREQQARLR